MLRATAILAAVCAAGLGVGALAGAAGGSPASSPTVIAVLGAKTNVPPRRFVKAYARCPRGYYVTGGGVYNGAITVIASSPMTNLRGWFVDGTNTSPAKRTFQERADAVCVKVGSGATVGAVAATAALSHRAEADFAISRRTRSGG